MSVNGKNLFINKQKYYQIIFYLNTYTLYNGIVF